MNDFSHYHGKEELSLAISKVNYLLQEIKIQGSRQSCIDDYFFVQITKALIDYSTCKFKLLLNCSPQTSNSQDLHNIFVLIVFLLFMLKLNTFVFWFRVLNGHKAMTVH